MKSFKKILQLIFHKKIALLLFSSTLLSVTVSSCKNIQSTQKNDLKKTPDNFGVNADTTNMAATPWKTFYDDENLNELIETGIKNNYDLLTLTQRIEASAAEFNFYKKDILPKLDVFANVGQSRFGNYTMDGVGNYDTNFSPNIKKTQKMKPDLLDLHTGLQFSWEIDIWSKLRNKKKASFARFLASVEWKNLLLTQLISQISLLYYELISLDNSLQIIEKSNDLLKNALDIIIAQKEAGFATELAVQQFQASLLNSETMEIQIKQSILENENNLNNLLGRFPQTISRKNIASLKINKLNLQVGTPQQLMKFRPDIKQKELELAAAKADVKSARAAFYPSLGINAGTGFHSFNPAFFLSPEALVYNIIGGLSAPLFNRNYIKAEYKFANAKQQIAFYEYQQTIIMAYLEVNTILNSTKNLNAMEELKRKETETLDKAIESSTELYKSGRAGYIEVLFAQKNALIGKMELNEIQKKLKQSEVNLYKALGGGWKN